MHFTYVIREIANYNRFTFLD